MVQYNTNSYCNNINYLSSIVLIMLTLENIFKAEESILRKENYI